MLRGLRARTAVRAGEKPTTSLRAGLAYTFGQPVRACVVLAAASTMIFNQGVMVLALATDAPGLPPRFGALMAAFGLGALGAIAARRWCADGTAGHGPAFGDRRRDLLSGSAPASRSPSPCRGARVRLDLVGRRGHHVSTRRRTAPAGPSWAGGPPRSGQRAGHGARLGAVTMTWGVRWAYVALAASFPAVSTRAPALTAHDRATVPDRP